MHTMHRSLFKRAR